MRSACGRRAAVPFLSFPRAVTGIELSHMGIVRPDNRDWACQTERCHTLSNKASLQ